MERSYRVVRVRWRRVGRGVRYFVIARHAEAFAARLRESGYDVEVAYGDASVRFDVESNGVTET